MAQPQSRRPQSATKSHSVRPVVPNYDRSSGAKPSLHHTPIRHGRRPSFGSSSVGKRRSSSLSRHPSLQVQSTNPQHHVQYSHGRMSPRFHLGSDTDSVASAPSLKYTKELRDVSSTGTSGRPVPKGKHVRDDSPVSRRSRETSLRHTKTARKVIEGELSCCFDSERL